MPSPPRPHRERRRRQPQQAPGPERTERAAYDLLRWVRGAGLCSFLLGLLLILYGLVEATAADFTLTGPVGTLLGVGAALILGSGLVIGIVSVIQSVWRPPPPAS